MKTTADLPPLESAIEAAIDAQLEQPTRRYAERYGVLLDVTFAVISLHRATIPPYQGIPTHAIRDVEAYDVNGNALGVTVQVQGDPLPGIWCAQCGVVAPCPTMLAIAAALKIKVGADGD